MAYSEPFSGHFKSGAGTLSLEGFVAEAVENPSHWAAIRKTKKQSEINPHTQKLFLFLIADLFPSSLSPFF
jgi:hypothetical protein